MTKRNFAKLAISTLGVTAAVLTLMASPARADEDGGGDGNPNCPGGDQACEDVTVCVGLPSNNICSTKHYYQKTGTP